MLNTLVFQRATMTALIAIPITLTMGTAALAEHVRFLLNNDTSVDLVEFYASPSTADDWEDNIIPEGELLRSRETVEVYIPDDGRGCLYDFLGVFADGNEREEYELNICEMENYTYSES